MEGEVTLKTVASAWIRWKELRKAALVATIQVNQVEVEEEREDEWEVMIAKTHFAQEWARDVTVLASYCTLLPYVYHYDVLLVTFSKCQSR